MPLVKPIIMRGGGGVSLRHDFNLLYLVYLTYSLDRVINLNAKDCDKSLNDDIVKLWSKY